MAALDEIEKDTSDKKILDAILGVRDIMRRGRLYGDEEFNAYLSIVHSVKKPLFKGEPELKFKLPTLNKKAKAVVDILNAAGYRMAKGTTGAKDQTSDIKGGITTVETAYNAVVSNQAGIGLTALAYAVARRDAIRVQKEREQGYKRAKPSILLLHNLKAIDGKLYDDSGREIKTDKTYRVFAIPKSIGQTTKYNSDIMEHRVVFMADGAEQGLKFSPRVAPDKQREALDMLHKGQMSEPFMIQVSIGAFNKNGKDIIYYKIESVEKVDRT